MKNGKNGTIFALAGIVLLLIVIVASTPNLFTSSNLSFANVSKSVILEEIPVDPFEDVNTEDYWLYYSGKNDHKLYRMETDGSDSQLILDINADYFFVKDDLAYYYTNEEISDFCEIRLDGAEQKTLLKGEISHVRVTDYGIYYIKADFKGPMYRIDLNGENDTLISSSTIDDYTIGKDGWIYYSDDDNDMRLTKMQIDGSDVQTIGNFKVSDINEYKDWLFFVNWSSISHLSIYRMKKNGTGLSRLNKTVSFINDVKDGWIYYNNEDDKENNYAVYRVNFNTKEIQKVSNGSWVKHRIIGKWLYYVEGNNIYRSLTDGTDNVLISDLEVDRIDLEEK